MSFTYNATLLLGSSQTGLTLKAALVDTTGTIHATVRDIGTGFIEIGSGNYLWVYASVPDNYRGAVVYYTGTLGAATVFTGVTVKTSSNVAVEEYGGLLDGAITDAKVTVPVVTGVATGVISMVVQLWRRFFKKATMTASECKTYADDGVTVLTTQALSDDHTTQTQGSSV